MIRAVEVCAANPESVRAAAVAGAARVELCSALSLDGLTPSAGMIEYTLSFPRLRVHVLVRPREGDFVYTDAELECMEADIRAAGRLGAHGVVFGVLTAEGTVDVAACHRLMAAAGDMDVTFHRAFDIVPDAFGALEDIISLGCSRVLTSGQACSAEAGIPMLARLHDMAAGRIRILAGAGVSHLNAHKIVGLGHADEVHGSFSVAGTNGIRSSSEDIIRKVVESVSIMP